MVALPIGLQFEVKEVKEPSSVLKSDTTSVTLFVSATGRGALTRTLTRTTLMMMDSPPQLSPPPELKSSLDQSELVVHELTGRTSC